MLISDNVFQDDVSQTDVETLKRSQSMDYKHTALILVGYQNAWLRSLGGWTRCCKTLWR